MSIMTKSNIVFSTFLPPFSETIGKKDANSSYASCEFTDVLKTVIEESAHSKTRDEKEEYIKTKLRRFMISAMLKHIDGDSGSIHPPQDLRSRQYAAIMDSMSSNTRRCGETTESEVGGHSDIEIFINRAAARFGVDPALIRGVIKVESNFDPLATSPKGAMGLMQLMPETARELGVVDPYDPEENIMAGTMYLRRLLDRYGGDVGKSLAAYNWGMGNVEKRFSRIPAETVEYVHRVIRLYEQHKA